MIEKEDKIDRRQVRCFVEDADWIEDEVKRREKVVGRRKVWPADVVRDAIGLLKSGKSGLSNDDSSASAKEAESVSRFRQFLRSAPKGDVHMVLSLIARFSGENDNALNLPERRSAGR